MTEVTTVVTDGGRLKVPVTQQYCVTALCAFSPALTHCISWHTNL